MDNYRRRVIDEQGELEARRGRLSAFMGTATYGGLARPDRILLRMQYKVMGLYSEILLERIKGFSDAER